MPRNKIHPIVPGSLQSLLMVVFLCGAAGTWARGQDVGGLTPVPGHATTRTHPLAKPYQHRPDHFYSLVKKTATPAKPKKLPPILTLGPTPLPTLVPPRDVNGKPITFWNGIAPKNYPSLFGDKPLKTP